MDTGLVCDAAFEDIEKDERRLGPISPEEGRIERIWGRNLLTASVEERNMAGAQRLQCLVDPLLELGGRRARFN